MFIIAIYGSDFVELMEPLGVNEVIDYKRRDFTKKDKTYDYAFAAVGKSSYSKCKNLLIDGGDYISFETGFLIENLLKLRSLNDND